MVGFEGLDGAVWLRTNFILPDDWINKELVLDLNRIRDQDYTYINGKLVGEQQNNEGRKYSIAKNSLHKGKNNIAILVLNFFDKGGVYGYKDTTKHIGIYPVNNEEAKISLNGQWKYLVQNDNPPPVGAYQASYQPFGDLNLIFPNTAGATNYKRELDISNAIASTSYSVNGIVYKREYFVSQPNQVLAINLTASKSASISFEISLSSPHKNFTVKKINANTTLLSVQVKNGALRGESYLEVKTNGGIVKNDNGKLIIEHADDATVFLTAGTNYKNYKDVSADPSSPCITALKNIKSKTYQQIRTAHIKEYQQYFNTFSITLGDSKISESENPLRGAGGY
jgi:alpha-L-fucosidase 2